MGYRLPERTALLLFEGSDYEGAEVRVSLKLKMGAFLEARNLQGTGDIEGLFRFMAGMVVDWNLEDAEGPIPPTYDGFLRLDDAVFINKLIEAWVEAMTAVPDPLGSSSSNGSTSTTPRSSISLEH